MRILTKSWIFWINVLNVLSVLAYLTRNIKTKQIIVKNEKLLKFLLTRPQNLLTSSLLIRRYVVNVKSMLKILSFFVAFLENMNFNVSAKKWWGPVTTFLFVPAPLSCVAADTYALSFKILLGWLQKPFYFFMALFLENK